MSLTHVRCLDPECGWQGGEHLQGERIVYRFGTEREVVDCCPKCDGNTIEGQWCKACGKAPLTTEGLEECDACWAINEAAQDEKVRQINENVKKLQKANRTYNEFRKVRDNPAEAARAAELRRELQEILGVAS